MDEPMDAPMDDEANKASYEMWMQDMKTGPSLASNNALHWKKMLHLWKKLYPVTREILVYVVMKFLEDFCGLIGRRVYEHE